MPPDPPRGAWIFIKFLDLPLYNPPKSKCLDPPLDSEKQLRGLPVLTRDRLVKGQKREKRLHRGLYQWAVEIRCKTGVLIVSPLIRHL